MEHLGQLVVYDEAHREDAVIYARKQRAAGCSVELILKVSGRTNADYEAYAKRRQIARVQFMDGNEPVKMF